MNERVDKLGAIASGACAVHCAICALLPVAFSALGLGFFKGHEAEWVFTAVATVFALGALVMGWRQHRSIRVVGLLAVGIVGLLASRGLEMGSEHDEHHGDHPAASAQATEARASAGEDERDVHHEASSKTEHHTHNASAHNASAHNAHSGRGHLAGTVIGVLSGFLLLFGHVLNLRTIRRRREEECCP